MRSSIGRGVGFGALRRGLRGGAALAGGRVGSPWVDPRARRIDAQQASFLYVGGTMISQYPLGSKTPCILFRRHSAVRSRSGSIPSVISFPRTVI